MSQLYLSNRYCYIDVGADVWCIPAYVFYQGDLQSIKLQLEETKQLIDSQRTEQQKLQMIITSMEEDRVQQQKQLQQVKQNVSTQQSHHAPCLLSERALL